VIAVVVLTIVLTVVIGGWLAKRPYPKMEKKSTTIKERVSPTPSKKALQSEEALSVQKNKRKRIPKVFDDEEPEEEIEEKKTKKSKSRSKSSSRSRS